MSQTQFKPAKFTIRNKEPGTLSKGANTVIELNGKAIPGVTFLKLEIKPKNIARLTLEMLVSIDDVELDADLKLVGIKNNPKLVSTLSKYESVLIEENHKPGPKR